MIDETLLLTWMNNFSDVEGSQKVHTSPLCLYSWLVSHNSLSLSLPPLGSQPQLSFRFQLKSLMSLKVVQLFNYHIIVRQDHGKALGRSQGCSFVCKSSVSFNWPCVLTASMDKFSRSLNPQCGARQRYATDSIALSKMCICACCGKYQYHYHIIGTY